MSVPRNESNASYYIKQKAANPESARLNVVLRNGYSYSRSASRAEDRYAAYCDSVEIALFETAKHEDKGRPAGSRIELINGEYKLV